MTLDGWETTFDDFHPEVREGDLVCHKCGKSARIGTPYVDHDGKIWCCYCAKEVEGVMLYGIEQTPDSRGNIRANPAGAMCRSGEGI
jgi:hypothetical protein